MALKIGGRSVDGPKKGLLVLPRSDGDIVFHFDAVLNDSDFEKLYPPPKPPVSFKTGVGRIENTEDPTYRSKLVDRETKRRHWMFLRSVTPTHIEWETVKLDQPDTWHLWESELEKAGFHMNERQAIFLEFLKTNLLTDDMLDEARTRFLASRSVASQAEQSSPPAEQKNIPSGGLVSDLTLAPLG